MEITNDWITKAEAAAEGFSIEKNNDFMTKAEFSANLPTITDNSNNFNTNNNVVFINNTSADLIINIKSGSSVYLTFTLKSYSTYITGMILDTTWSSNKGIKFSMESMYKSNNNGSHYFDIDVTMNANTSKTMFIRYSGSGGAVAAMAIIYIHSLI